MIEIDESRNQFRAQFEVCFRWNDTGLTYLNLNPNNTKTRLTDQEVESIWLPKISLGDFYIYNREINEPPFVSVLRSSSPFTLAPHDNLHKGRRQLRKSFQFIKISLSRFYPLTIKESFLMEIHIFTYIYVIGHVLCYSEVSLNGGLVN